MDQDQIEAAKLGPLASGKVLERRDRVELEAAWFHPKYFLAMRRITQNGRQASNLERSLSSLGPSTRGV